MEDMWAELSLSSLVHRSTAVSAAPSSPFPGLRLQPFLDCPIREDKPQTENLSSDNRSSVRDKESDSRKRNRLMKNRESAVRSRARKQAYTYELELEVGRLVKENAKLRKYIEECGEKEKKSQVVAEEDAQGRYPYPYPCIKKKKKNEGVQRRTTSAPF